LPIPRHHIALLAGLLVIVLLSAALIWMNRILFAPAPDWGGGDSEIEIRKGMNLDQIARLLEKERLISSRNRFVWAARLMQADRKLQPGRFLLPHGAGNARLIRFLLRPGIRTLNVTIPEGLSFRQIAAIFHREMGIDSALFVSLCEDPAFTDSLGIPDRRLEGYLFPDTYNFYSDASPRDIIGRMTAHFLTVLNESLRQELVETGLDVHQIVTLASIIQGEVMIDSEASRVSAVYRNRLKRGIPLAADPTIQYIIPDGPRRLLTSDLDTDSPYNTYRHAGLPPGPINNPGKTALLAAVHPARVDDLYFVAVGDGSHAFNTTLAGHNRDKAKFQRVRIEQTGNTPKAK
jgi:UPF0755 protein